MAIEGFEAVIDYGAIGSQTATVAQAVAAAQVVKASDGVLCRVTVTVLGTSALSIYDNAAAAAGTVLFTVPANAPVGSVYDVRMPANNGITVAAQTATTPGLTLSYL